MFVSANQVFQTIFFKGKIVSLFWKKESYLFLKRERESICRRKQCFHCYPSVPNVSLFFPRDLLNPPVRLKLGSKWCLQTRIPKWWQRWFPYHTLFVCIQCPSPTSLWSHQMQTGASWASSPQSKCSVSLLLSGAGENLLN